MSILAVALLWGVSKIPIAPQGLQQEVNTWLPASGVQSPVTAVLLNFRGYDTLLELHVLLVAVLGAWALGKSDNMGLSARPNPLLVSFVRQLGPLLVLTAGYLLWRGSHAPGGAFQAGALLGAAAILQHLSLPADQLPLIKRPLRPLLLLGPAIFLAVSLATLMLGGYLEYPKTEAGSLILLIESAATVSVGAILYALFLGGEPREHP